MLYSFFFDIRFTPVYEIIYALMYYFALYGPAFHMATDMLFLSAGVFIVEYLKIVQRKFTKTVATNNNVEVYQAIEFHKRVIRATEMLSILGS